MAMTAAERKRKQRSNPAGYGKDREQSWKRQGIKISRGFYVQFLEMIVAQGGKCLICGDPIDNTACLDHDHETGFPRGAVCSRCNLLVGHIEAAHTVGVPDYIAKVEEYLRIYSAQEKRSKHAA